MNDFFRGHEGHSLRSNKAGMFLFVFSTDMGFVAPDSTLKEPIKKNKNGIAILLRIR